MELQTAGQGDLPKTAPTAAEPTRYFHLLDASELKELRPALEILRDRRDEVLSQWHEFYASHFGAARSLDEAGFRELFGRDLDSLVKNLLDGDMDGFEADMRTLGLALVDAGVPFAEVVASLHLFEESAAAFFQSKLKLVIRGPSVYLTFDKLSHCRMILLAGAYFAGREAAVASRVRSLESEATELAGGAAGRNQFHGLVGRSPAMRRVYEQIAAAAGGHGAVFIAGESGTGKELVARALHECAGGAARPFVALNCAALSPELIESELFGHKRGAYTGAHEDYAGLVRAAADGTLFLDEITEMPATTQAKLLRVLEERTVRPVGTTHEMPVRARFVASSNRDPEKAVESGVLRKDLWYRLCVHRLEIPPLRDRLGDIPVLTAHFLDLFQKRGLRAVEGVDDDFIAALQAHQWPGNVRELKNAVEYALTAGTDPRLHRRDLPSYVTRRPDAGEAAPVQATGPVPTFAEMERELIRRALDANHGNKVQAAKSLRISRHRLYDKLRKFGIEL